MIPPQKAAASSAAAAPAGEMVTGAKHQWKVFDIETIPSVSFGRVVKAYTAMKHLT